MNALLQKNFISTKEASLLSGYNADYLSRLCREKRIAGSQIGRTWLIERASLESFMESQVDRKIEIAESLARERGLEYRKANSPTARITKVTDDLEERVRAVTQSVFSVLSVVSVPSEAPMFGSRAVAVALTALILAGSVTLAGSGVVSRTGEALLASAFDARSFVLSHASNIGLVAQERSEALVLASREEVQKVDTTLAYALDERIETLPLVVSKNLAQEYPLVEVSKVAFERAEEIYARYPVALSSTEIATGFTYAVTHPTETLAAVAHGALRAYSAIGVYALNDIETVLALHLRMVEAGGEGLFSAGVSIRDTAYRTPLAIGNVFVGGSEAVMSLYEDGVYAYVENIAVVPETIVGAVYHIGNTSGAVLATGIQLVPVAYEEGVLAFAETSSSAATLISNGSYAFGKGANEQVSGFTQAQDRFVGQGVASVRLALAGLNGRATQMAAAIESGPSVASNQALQFAGDITLRIENTGGEMLAASPLASIDLDQFIPGFLKNVTAVIARAVGSAFHGIFGPLAGFFGASEEVGLAVIPGDTVSPGSNEGEGAEVVAGDTNNYNGPVTIIRNEYPTVNYGGVPQSYVDERFDFLRRTLYNRIEDVSGDRTFSGDINNSSITESTIDDSSFSNGVIENSEITGGTIVGSALDVATTTITGSLTVNGDLSVSGNVSGNSTTTNATTTNFYATNGIIENILGTNATFTNATTTNFYAVAATILDGFFTNFTATLANITTAIIANLTATNATFTNATTTNATSTGSLALTYVTPSRLLSVGANGVVASTNLSSWISGTLNQLTVTDNGIGGITLSLPSTIVIGSSQPTSIASNGATSTFGGGLQATFVEGIQYLAGPYVLATSTTATSAFSGNIAVGRNTTLGTTAADFLTVNSSISSNLIPSANNTYDIGSVGNNWNRIYVDEVVANNLSAASTSISGTVSESFTINSDNASADAEDSSIVFNRGSASPNALITWNAATDRFEFNMPVFSADGIFTNATSTNLTATNLTLGGATFTSLLGNGLVNSGGALTVSTTSLASGFFQQGGNSFGTTATLGTNDAQSLQFETNGTAKLTILSGGNVGIGNASPGQKLDVAGYVQATSGFLPGSSSDLRLSRVASGTLLVDTFGTGSSAIRLGYSGSVYSTWAMTDTTAGNLTLSTTGGSSGHIILSPNATGNVGIDTTSPGYPLDVNGAINTRGLLRFGSNSETAFASSDHPVLYSSSAAGASYPFQTAGNLVLQSRTSGSARDVVFVGNTTPAVQMVIQGSTGNVGVGTTTPQARLSLVAASGIGDSLIIASTTGSRMLTVNSQGSLIFSGSGQSYKQYSGADESGPAVFINRTIGSEATANEHGIIDATLFGRSTMAYNSYDSQAVLTGSNNYDHFAGFQNRGKMNSSGSLSDYYSFGSFPDLSAGATTNVFGFYAANPSGVGAITNNYGVYVENQTRGTNNYAVYTAGTAQSYFGGNVGIGTTTPTSLLDLYKNTDGYTKITVRNPNTGTDALSGIDFLQDIGGTGSIYVTGNTFDGNGDFGALPGYANSLWLDASFELSGGLKLVARNADIGFYAGSRSVQNVTISGTNGNLGVGSTTPFARLSVKGAGTGTGIAFQTTDSANVPGLSITDNGRLMMGTTTSTFPAFFVSSGSQTLVGQRDSSSTSLTSSVVSGAAVRNANTTNNNYSALQFLGIDTGGTGQTFGHIANVMTDHTTGSVDSDFAFVLRNNNLLSEAMRITGTGSVGIGTTTPTAQLAINSGVTEAIRISSISNGRGIFADNGSSNGMFSFTRQDAVTPGSLSISAFGGIGFTGNSNSYNNAVASAYQMYLSPAGNVGIGSTNPLAKLHILSGTQNINNVQSNSVAVFEAANVASPYANVSIHTNTSAAADVGGTLGLGGLYRTGTLDAINYAVIRGAKENSVNSNFAGYLSFSTYTNGGSLGERMRIGSTGNVGIGTTSPNFKLQVSGTGLASGDTAGQFTITNSANALQKLYMGYDSTLGTNGSGFIQAAQTGTGYTPLLLNPNGGNVGIGTTSPSSLLTVESASSPIIQINRSAASGDALLRLNSQGVNFWDAGIVNDSSSSAFTVYDRVNSERRIVALQGSDANLLFQPDGGNVGIGTTAPGDKLHVYDATGTVGNPTIRLESLVGGYGAGVEAGSIVTGGSYLAMGKAVWDGENSWNTTASLQDSYFTLHTTENGTLGEKFRITSAGNVGIGTTNPGSHKLVVVGGNANTLRIDNAGEQYTSADFYNNGSSKATTYYDNSAAQFIMRTTVAADIGFDTNLTRRMTILSGGNVGIGTASPTATYGTTLHIAGSTGGSTRYTGSSVDGAVGVLDAASGMYMGTLSNHGLFLMTNSAERLTVSAAGNIGIGTTNPVYKLHVQGDGMILRNAGRIDSDWFDSAIGGDNGYWSWSLNGALGPNTFGLVTRSDGGVFGAEALRFTRSGTSISNVTFPNGNVGIGLSDPQTKLTVLETVDGGRGATMFLRNDGTVAGSETAIYFGYGASQTVPNAGNVRIRQIGTPASDWGGDLSFDQRTGASSWQTNLFIQRTTGNVGIGTAGPSQKLHVNGNALVDSFVRGDDSGIFFRDGFTHNVSLTVKDWGSSNVSSDGLLMSGYDGIGFMTSENTYNAANVRLFIQGGGGATAGYVGIGDTTPDAKFDILQASDTSAQGLQISRSNDTDYTRLYKSAGLGSLSDPLIFNTSFGGDVAAIGRDGSAYFAGNVGIGTNSPGVKLDVVNVTGAVGTDTIVGSFAKTSTNGGGSATLRVTSDGYSSDFQTNSAGTAPFTYGTYADTNIINQYTAAGGPYGNINFVTNGAVKMTITGGNASGNVGVGTTTPGYKFTSYAAAGTYAGTFGDNTGGVALGAYAGGVPMIQGGTDTLISLSKALAINPYGGNVGIGTTNPSTGKLQVHGTANNWSTYMLGSATTGQSYGMLIDAGTNSSDTAFRIRSYAGTDYVHVRGDGLVGIGTASPTDKLTVQVATNKRLGVEEVTSSGISDYSVGGTGIQFSRTSDGSDNLSGLYNYTSGGGLQNFALAARSDLVFAAGSGSTYTAAPERMRILANGNVGIGTASPTTKLDVSDLSGNPGIQATGAVTGSPYLQLNQTSTTRWYVQWNNAGSYSDYYSSGAHHFQGGSVGIGVSAPLGKLHVAGNATGAKVDNLVLSNNDSGAGAGTTIYMGYQTAGLGAYGARIAQTGNPGSTRRANLYLQLHNDATAANDDTGWDSVVSLIGGSTNFVGINNTGPSVALDVTGDIEYTGTITDVSDRRLKENIQDIENPFSILSAINGKTYNMIGSNRPEVGFLAQDVQAVLPNTAKVVDPENGYLGVSYMDFIPYLVEGVNELNVRTLSIAPAAQNQEAYSLAVSADASVAGILTVTGTGTFNDTLTAASILSNGSVTATSFLTETNDSLPNEVLTGGEADLYKMANYAITGMQTLAQRTDLILEQLDTIEGRLAALELSQSAEPGFLGISPDMFKSLLAGVGIAFEEGITSIEKLVAERLTVGSVEKPTGITLYDEETGEPYCLSIGGGSQNITPGECQIATPTTPEVTPTPVPQPTVPVVVDEEPPTPPEGEEGGLEPVFPTPGQTNPDPEEPPAAPEPVVEEPPAAPEVVTEPPPAPISSAPSAPTL